MSQAPIEPKHTISIFKWNVKGAKKLLKQEMYTDDKHKVKVLVSDTYLNIIKINHKYPGTVPQAYEEVKAALKEYYPELSVGFRKAFTKK